MYIHIGLKDDDKEVKSAACWTMTQFAEFLQPDIVDHYEDMLPGVLQCVAVCCSVLQCVEVCYCGSL